MGNISTRDTFSTGNIAMAIGALAAGGIVLHKLYGCDPFHTNLKRIQQCETTQDSHRSNRVLVVGSINVDLYKSVPDGKVMNEMHTYSLLVTIGAPHLLCTCFSSFITR